jgi:hypothetical protein
MYCTVCIVCKNEKLQKKNVLKTLGTQYTGRRQKNNNTENLNNEQHGPNKKNKIKNKQTNKHPNLSVIYYHGIKR